MFGRRRRQQEAEEAERRALLAELAKRPDTVCPFLGLADARAEYRDGVTAEHRCYAFGDPAELSDEQQTKVCLQRGYGNCPRYLRGVLVIPTEELEALRRPQAPPEEEPVVPVPAGRGGGRRRVAALVLVIVLAVAGGGTAAFLALRNNGPVAVASSTPTPTPAATPMPTPSPLPPTPPPSTTPPTPTPFPETPSPEPTPTAGDVFIGYAITVLKGDYVIYHIDAEGQITDQLGATFSDYSKAQVDEVTAPNGLHYWRTLDGDYAGYCYIYPQSGPFLIREVYEGADGTLRYTVLPESRL